MEPMFCHSQQAGWLSSRALPYSIGERMNFPIQFSQRRKGGRGTIAPGGAALLLMASLLCGASARAEDTPNVIGRVAGTDVSVQGPSMPGGENDTHAPSILVGNGSVVTVHAGDARMVLTKGGHIDICGPAKFTMLQSGGAITLALDFGRVRLQVPANVTLRLFTPRIVATPLDISGGTRDVTVGLALDESLCVLATNGAIQLEHQFSGEKLIVPEQGEFFLNGGQLLPVAGKPGSCQCAAMQTAPPVPSSGEPLDYAGNVAPATAQPGPPPGAGAAQPSSAPNIEFSVPAHANEEHPATPAPKNNAAPAPAAPPVYTVVAPLSFTAGTPLPALILPSTQCC